MDKQMLIQFIKDKRRGCYTVLIEMYFPVIHDTPITMALEIIRKDLQKESKEPVQLNYFSLAKALTRFRIKNPKPSPSKFEFKDAHQYNEGQSIPGSFKLD